MYRFSFSIVMAVMLAGSACAGVGGEEAEVRFVERLVEAGDPFVGPMVVGWLAAEQDGQRIGQGGARLAMAIHAAERLRVKQAVPWLVAMCDVPGLMYELGTWRDKAAMAAIRIDPEYSKAFLKDLMKRETPDANRMVVGPGVLAAAALAERFDDEEARQFLLAGYEHHRGAGWAVDVLSDGMEGLPIGEMVRCSDVKLREGLLELSRKLKGKEQSQAEEVAEQMRVNGLSDRELLKMAVEGKGRERRRALSALGWVGPASALETLDKLAAVEGEKVIDERGAAQIGSAQWAAVEVRCRFGLGKLAIDPPRWEAAAEKSTQGPKDSVGPYTLRFSGVSNYPHPDGKMRPVVVFYDIARYAPRMLCHKVSEELLEKGRGIALESVVWAWFSPDFKDLMAIESVPTRAGETADDAYVLIEKTKVKDGATERTAVVLGKLGKRVVARVPNRTGADGAVGPDSKILKALEAVSSGEVVNAGFEQAGNLTMLEWIAPYRPWVKAKYLGEKEGAMELEVARRTIRATAPRRAGGGEPSLGEAMLVGVKPGWEIRVRFAGELDVEEKVALPLRAVALEGYISRRISDPFVMVVGRRASFQGSSREGVYKGSIGAHGRESESSRLRSGLVAVLDRKAKPAADLTAEKLAAMRAARNIRGGHSPGAAERVAQALVLRDHAKSSGGRFEAEQDVYLELAKISSAMEEEEAEQIRKVKEILTAEEYGLVLKAGTLR